ncbi:MAG: hypothetical protein ACRELF_10135 [Gemmataceae bacterium]
MATRFQRVEHPDTLEACRTSGHASSVSNIRTRFQRVEHPDTLEACRHILVVPLSDAP